MGGSGVALLPKAFAKMQNNPCESRRPTSTRRQTRTAILDKHMGIQKKQIQPPDSGLQVACIDGDVRLSSVAKLEPPSRPHFCGNTCDSRRVKICKLEKQPRPIDRTSLDAFLRSKHLGVFRRGASGWVSWGFRALASGRQRFEKPATNSTSVKFVNPLGGAETALCKRTEATPCLVESP